MEQDKKTGEQEALCLLRKIYPNDCLKSCDRPDILRFSKQTDKPEEGIEVITCSNLDREIQGRASHGVNDSKFAMQYIESLKRDMVSPVDVKILNAIKTKIEKWKSGRYKDCKMKSIAVVVSDFVKSAAQTVAMLLTDDNQVFAESMSVNIGMLCSNSKISHIYVIFLEDDPNQLSNTRLRKRYSVWTYDYKGLIKDKCFYTSYG